MIDTELSEFSDKLETILLDLGYLQQLLKTAVLVDDVHLTAWLEGDTQGRAARDKALEVICRFDVEKDTSDGKNSSFIVPSISGFLGASPKTLDIIRRLNACRRVFADFVANINQDGRDGRVNQSTFRQVARNINKPFLNYWLCSRQIKVLNSLPIRIGVSRGAHKKVVRISVRDCIKRMERFEQEESSSSLKQTIRADIYLLNKLAPDEMLALVSRQPSRASLNISWSNAADSQYFSLRGEPLSRKNVVSPMPVFALMRPGDRPPVFSDNTMDDSPKRIRTDTLIEEAPLLMSTVMYRRYKQPYRLKNPVPREEA
jgi:hypothetical protein